jgi:ribosome biogenesis protein Nip4
MIDLLKQYVDGGVGLSEYQFNKLPKGIKKTYIRRRMMNNESLRIFELKFIKEELNNNGFNDEMMTTIIKYEPNFIEFFDEPAEKYQLMAVEKNPYLIGYIANPTENVQLFAVKEDIGTIRNIKKPAHSVQSFVINRDIENIEHINQPADDIILSAIRHKPWLIGVIRNPPEFAKIEAVTINPKTIKYIEKPSEKVQLKAVENYAYAIVDINVDNLYPSVIKLHNKLWNKK